MYVHPPLISLFSFPCSEDSTGDLPITGKATNPYVASPNKSTTLSSAPADEADETTVTRCEVDIYV